MTTESISAEWVESEQYLGPRMKRIMFECAKCGHVWTRTYKAEPKQNPNCPSKRCAERAEVADLKKQLANLTAMLESGVAPAQIGQNIRTKAIDKTAEIVMEDHHLTDLKDNIRAGETMAPRLPGGQQALADNLFTAPKTPGGRVPVVGASRGRGTIPSTVMERIGKRAITGGYRGNSVSPMAIIPKERPPAVSVANPRHNPNRPSAEGYKGN